MATRSQKEKRGAHAMPSAARKVISRGSPKVEPAFPNHPIRRRHSLYSCPSTESLPLPPVIKRVNCCGIRSNTNTNTNTNMKMRAAPMMDSTDFDFDNLPPAVRRKYFSSLERLRYAQQQQSNSSRSSTNHNRHPTPPNARFPRPGSKSRTSNDSFRSNPSPTRTRKQQAGSIVDDFILSQADAHWFLELPETIRRKHFSREERILLASKCESIIVDAADETIYRMGRQANRSLNTLESLSTYSSDDSSDDSRQPSLDMDAIDDFRKSFGWMDNGGALDLSLDEYCCSRSPPFDAPTSQRVSLRRTLSLSTRTFRSHSSGASSLPKPSLTGRSSSHTPNTVGCQPSIAQGILNSTDTEATYYQDPEARLKLRVYLASPQKFDEAIEFGFPSTSEANEFFKTRPKTATIRHVQPEDDPIFSKEESSFDDFDDSSLAGGKLLSGYDFQLRRELEQPVSASPIMPSRISSPNSFRPRDVDPYLHSAPGSREMTLRMTLTRKDLRADETELYGWKKEKYDPLALEELPPMSDPDALPFDWSNAGKENDSGLKKLWRKVRNTSR